MKKISFLVLFIIFAFAASSVEAQKKPEGNAKTSDKTSKTSLEYTEEGSAAFIKGNYKQAIEPYQKALDLEKENPKLNKTFWYVLIDNLAMTYGITGNLEKSKETLEYGISKDAKYPMFYYIMANTYAEMDNEDKAIEYLKQAFEYKDNMIKGEQMPNPATDDSFERYMNSEKFLKTLEEIKKKDKNQ